MNDISKVCDEYIDSWNDVLPGYALLIKGKWGSGKTYYIKQYINSSINDGAILYVSLYGVNSKEDIDNKLFEAVHVFCSNKNIKKCIALGSAILRGAIKHTCQIDIKDISDSVGKVFSDKSNVIPENGYKAIVFDDLERMSLDIEVFFGYIVDLLQDIRIIFIANEDEIGEEYAKFKEKIIGEEYSFNPCKYEAVKAFWDSECTNRELNDTDLEKEWKSKSLDIFNQLKVENLRLLRQTIHQWCGFYKNIPEEVKFDKEYMKNVFDVFFVLGIRFKNAEFTSQYDKSNSFTDLINDIWSSYEQGVEKKYIGISNRLPLYKEWENIFRDSKFINSEWVKQKLEYDYLEYQEFNNMITDKKDPMNELYDCIINNKYENVDCKNLFERVCDKFKGGQYLEYAQIKLFVRLYGFLLFNNVLSQKYSQKNLCDMLDNFIDEYEIKLQKESIDIEDLNSQSSEIPSEIKNKLLMLADTINDNSIKEFFSKQESFCKLIERSDNALNYFIDKPSLKKITELKNTNIDSLMENVLGNDLIQHERFEKFLEKRYGVKISNYEYNHNYAEDIPILEEIKKYYEEKCNNVKNTFDLRVISYDRLEKQYTAMLKHVYKLKNRNQQN